MPKPSPETPKSPAPDYLAAFETATGLVLTRRCGEAFVPIAAAQAVVEFLVRNDAVILGFEGFVLTEHETRPMLDYITDFSTIQGTHQERVAASAEAARRILALWQEPTFVSFVID